MTNKTLDDILDSIPKPKNNKQKKFGVIFNEEYGTNLVNILLKREDGFDFNVNSLLPEGYTIRFTEKYYNRCLQKKKIIYLSKKSMSQNLNIWITLHEIGHAWQPVDKIFDTICKQYDKKLFLTEDFKLKCESQIMYLEKKPEYFETYTITPIPSSFEDLELIHSYGSELEYNAHAFSLYSSNCINNNGFNLKKHYNLKKILNDMFNTLKTYEIQRIDGLSRLFDQKTIDDKYRSLYIKNGKIYWEEAIVCSTLDIKIREGIFPKLIDDEHSKKMTIRKIMNYKL